MRNLGPKVAGLMVVVVCGPVCVVAALSAVVFGLRQFVSGWIPSRWLSDNPADWVFGLGIEGDAGNYAGFMVSAVVSAACWSAVQWGTARLRAS